MPWKPIAEAPRDGTPVLAAKESSMHDGRFPYPLTSIFVDGKWCALCAGEWKPYDPQPTHYQTNWIADVFAPLPADEAKLLRDYL
jgi:hypothetical protein